MSSKTEPAAGRSGRVFRNSGYVAITVWLTTLLIALTMMWDKRWMESNPPSEIFVGVLHATAVLVGLGLGASLLVPDIRSALTRPQIASFAASSVLACFSASRFL